MTVSVVLFDLGGVIVEMTGAANFLKILGHDDGPTIWRRWLKSPAVHAHETGACDRDEFARRLIKEFELTISEQDFLAAFLAWPGAIFEGAENVVENIRPDIRKGCLSNTSSYHWEHQQAMTRLHPLFPLHYLSFEIGVMKPHAPLFEHVRADLDCPANEILFFDDLKGNVEAAQIAGWQAHRVDGPETARTILAELDLLADG